MPSPVLHISVIDECGGLQPPKFVQKSVSPRKVSE